MTTPPNPSTGKRLGYRADLATATTQTPEPAHLNRLFVDRLDTIHSPRPALQQLVQQARPGDTVVAVSMADLARSITDLHHVITTLTGRGVIVEFSHENVTFSPQGAASDLAAITVLDAIAAFERTRVRERQRAGIEAAKAQGKYTGSTQRLNPDQVRQLLDESAAGTPKTELARTFGISRETVYQYLRRASEENKAVT